MNTVSELLKVKGNTVWTISPVQPVIEAIRLMADKNIGALMVVEGEKLCGVVSERDYTRNIALQDRSSRDTTVREIMTTQTVTVTSDDTLNQCMALMTVRGFRHLPVVDDDRLIGVLSMPDLVKVIVEQQQFTIDQLESYINQ
ncbi:MAG: CBS domain-containing protein [Granulosicoccus sp.]|nr:CBS domain-containing protein [Granulosicoccus sp.]